MGASNMKKIFYLVLFASNLVGVFPVAHFLTAKNNPNCGPLRSYECAIEEAFGIQEVFSVSLQNTTACNAQFVEGRSNYAAFVETLLPVSLDNYNPIEAFVDATINNNSTKLETFTSNCSFSCWVSLVLSSIFSSVTLLMVALVMCIALFFVRKQATRLVRELDAANEECAC